MSLKKRLFKRISLIFFFLITFFCIKGNAYAASFPYDKFDWDSFLEQHRDYWVSNYCDDGNKKCVDEVLKTKEKFYKRLYALLTEFDKKGYHIDDNIIIETVFYGLTPDSFADYDKIEEEYVGHKIESGYNIDEGITSDDYIASIDENAKDYFDKETDTLKTLMNNMIGYYRECYGYAGAVTTTESGSTCSDPNAKLIDGECWTNVKTIKTNFFDSIGLSFKYSNSSLEKTCEEAAKGYSSFKLGNTSNDKEVNEELYWDFLINNVYFDNKFQLQSYFSSVLAVTGHESMKELSSEEYKKYEVEIKEARSRIVNNIKDILGSYGNFAETPNSAWTYMSDANYSYSSSSNNYWWPIGGSEITGSGSVQMAIGDPVSTTVTSNYGLRTYPKKGMHYGVDIAGATGIANVIATKSGIVIYSTKSAGINCPDLNDVNSTCGGGGYGNYVILQHNDGSYTLYAHLAQNTVLVENGQSVMQGQVIGKVGSSGSSTGGHLHFELRIGGNSSQNTVDPLIYISATEPRKTGMEYQYDENGNIISDGSLTTAIIYIHSWEGTPKSSGDDYIAFDDGYNNITIGWGIYVSEHKDKFEALGVNVDNIVAGSKISMDIVDRVEQQIIQEFADSVKSMLSNSGISLTSYQIDALISRTYNCGTGGIVDFPDAYKEYGITYALYENFLSKPTNSNGVFSVGLERRRRGEWLLFSQGQYQITV